MTWIQQVGSARPTRFRPSFSTLDGKQETTEMPNDALVAQLIGWIGQKPRSYAETIDAWRTSCPRLTVWEDALAAGLIERVPAASLKEAQVRVTPAGQAYAMMREADHAQA